MIRIRKPEAPPLILRERGVALTAELCSKVDAGELPSFDADTYGAAEVKQALRTAQHDKCCFCESKLGHAQFGDIEHFSPKKHAPVAGNARGSTTVEALQLNRPDLVERRRERRQDLLAWMIILVEAIRRGPSDDMRESVTRVLNTIIAKVADNGEYASMARSVLHRVAPWREHWMPPVAALLEELQADTAGAHRFHVDEI